MRPLYAIALVALLGAGAVAVMHAVPRGDVSVLRRSVVLEGGTRDYLVYARRIAGGPMPVVVALHGGGGPLGSAERMVEHSGWLAVAQKEDVIVVFPQGILERPDDPIRLEPVGSSTERNIRSWNDGSGRTPAAVRGVDDVSYIEAVLTDVAAHYPVDPSRVYVTGFSNGATMTFYLGVQIPSFIAAIAPVAGLLYATVPALPSPVSLLLMSGRSDAVPQHDANQAVPDPISVWDAYLGCTSTAIKSAPGLTTRESVGCARGAVRHIVVDGLGHAYPGKEALFGEQSPQAKIDATSVIWGFFKSVPKR